MANTTEEQSGARYPWSRVIKGPENMLSFLEGLPPPTMGIKSWESGQISVDCKLANIPSLKKGKKSDPGIYRVIHLADQGKPVDVIFLNFSKAFDTVSHNNFLDKKSSPELDKHIRWWERFDKLNKDDFFLYIHLLVNLFTNLTSLRNYHFLNLYTSFGSSSCLESIAVIQSKLQSSTERERERERERETLPQAETDLAWFEGLEASLQNQEPTRPRSKLDHSLSSNGKDLVHMEINGNISADNLFLPSSIITDHSFSRPAIKYKH
ncbi:hypothetical protein WISP_65370 [Willisornis vidua]|uniref:Reverse transcriptase domain-containing protein n=1 Tax=Willisornis vidua TaxID=1566151 RepID=A0ABQ9DEB3_9PASS|nr:hypothetical protein WISP_65370 [Willisornis vidua]